MANKVKYGLENVYYAVWDESEDTYETPVAIKGAVNLSVSAEGGATTFRADNVDYWTSVANNGYSGTLELAMIPDSFMVDVMGEVKNATSGVQYEVANVQPKAFALLFQFEGDVNATRHVLYNCKATRPNVEGETTGETIDPKTETINLTAKARPTDHVVKAKVEAGATAYSGWFSAVTVPALTA